jgi:hypothetical protein
VEGGNTYLGMQKILLKNPEGIAEDENENGHVVTKFLSISLLYRKGWGATTPFPS